VLFTSSASGFSGPPLVLEFCQRAPGCNFLNFFPGRVGVVPARDPALGPRNPQDPFNFIDEDEPVLQISTLQLRFSRSPLIVSVFLVSLPTDQLTSTVDLGLPGGCNLAIDFASAIAVPPVFIRDLPTSLDPDIRTIFRRIPIGEVQTAVDGTLSVDWFLPMMMPFHAQVVEFDPLNNNVIVTPGYELVRVQ